MRGSVLAGPLVVALALPACFAPAESTLEIGDLSYWLGADPEGGRFLFFNFTVYNNGSVDADTVRISIDGLNRTPPSANHYGRAERTLRHLPAGESFVIQGRLDVYSACSLADPGYAECAHGTTYFTIRAEPANGPPAVRLIEDETNH